MKKAIRCPYHVKQGLVNSEGKLVITDICGSKSACGMACPFVPFLDNSYKSCSHFLADARGMERQPLVPKNDLEYAAEVNGTESFSEIEYL